jgi:hypothetical protein
MKWKAEALDLADTAEPSRRHTVKARDQTDTRQNANQTSDEQTSPASSIYIHKDRVTILTNQFLTEM